MRIDSLSLRNFRNIEECEWDLGEGIHVLWGDNGEGKTNFLESIYFLSYCRPLRGDSVWSLIKWGKDAARVDGCIAEDGLTRTLRVTLDRKSGQSASINGEVVRSLKDYIGVSLCTVFHGEDTKALFGPPPGRRKIVDQICYLLHPGYGEEYLRYLRCLRQRNTLLKRIREGGQGSDVLLLDSLDEVIVPLAEKISSVRRDVFEELRSVYAEVLCRLGDGVDGELVGHFNFERSIFEREKGNDLGRGYTGYGPHRQDFKVVLSGVDGRRHASTGQKRLCALCLRLSQAIVIGNRKGKLPIMLLDDMTSELDRRRRDRLMRFVSDWGFQTVVTTTDWRLLPEGVDYASVRRVQGGRIM